MFRCPGRLAVIEYRGVIRQLVATGMAQHVRVLLDAEICHRPVQNPSTDDTGW